MTKKHFIAIARELKWGRDQLLIDALKDGKNSTERAIALHAYDAAIQKVIDGINAVAPTFDDEIFWKFIKGEK